MNRCENGRNMRHDPHNDDPYLETDTGECPRCGGKGCDEPAAPCPSCARLQDEVDKKERILVSTETEEHRLLEENARLQAELDAARRERDEERNAHAELQARCYDYGGTGQNVFSDLANLRAINEQYINMDALKDSQLAALRTRLESVPPREPTFEMVQAGMQAWEDDPYTPGPIDVWRAMYDAAIDTAATQGGAK